MVNIDYETILPDIEELIENQNAGALLNILVDLHPADIEEILNRLKKDERHYVFNILPNELASEVLSELETPIIEQVLEGVTETKITNLVDEMESDDAADLIAELPVEVADKVMDRLTEESAQEVKELLPYKEDTAGGIMAVEVISMPETATVNETIERIRERRDEFEALYNIWVVDSNHTLIGSVSLKDLVLAKGYTTLREIMNIDVHSIHVDMDQEEAANYFRRYDLVSVPVVNDNGQLIGRITVDDIVDVLEEEGSEDMGFVAGAPDEEVLEESAFAVSKARIPWLLVSFVGNIIAAFVLKAFNVTIESHIASAFFFPLIMAMGGSTGQQASVIVVRGLATGDIHSGDSIKRLFKEFRVSLINSFIFAILIFGFIYYWQGILFASILSISLFIVINGSSQFGALLPFMFKRLNIDPALATAPFIATTIDIFGLLVYLSILSLGLGLFG
ncbi:MAG: magnesium transporter [Calditrichaceae bacterium]|nr:magnesium transporter [Calditrichaceae bacterium]